MHMSWMYTFSTIGILIGVLAILNLILLIDEPSKVNIVIDQLEVSERKSILNRLPSVRNSLNIQKSSINNDKETRVKDSKEDRIDEILLDNEGNNPNNPDSSRSTEQAIEVQGISFWRAWLIPGVIPYAICIAFVKSGTYGMLFWLPLYARKELGYNHFNVGLIAISYDLGVIFGSIILGKTSDLIYTKRAPVAYFSLLLTSIFFFLVTFFPESMVLVFLVGFFLGGVFNIIAATAAIDLAKRESLKGNDKALATVSGILDGSGSLGAAFGSIIIGEIRMRTWSGVFIYLSISMLISSFTILRAMVREIKEIIKIRKGE